MVNIMSWHAGYTEESTACTGWLPGCVCVCACVCVCVCVYTQTHTCMETCVYILPTHTHMDTYNTQLALSVRAHKNTHTRTNMQTHVHTPSRTHTNKIPGNIHTNMHTLDTRGASRSSLERFRLDADQLIIGIKNKKLPAATFCSPERDHFSDFN